MPRSRRFSAPTPPAPTLTEVCAEFEPLRLVQARNMHGWRRADLADASGITAQRICHLESAVSKPQPWELTKLAEVLEVPHAFFRRGRPMAVLDSSALFMCTTDR